MLADIHHSPAADATHDPHQAHIGRTNLGTLTADEKVKTMLLQEMQRLLNSIGRASNTYRIPTPPRIRLVVDRYIR